LSKEAKDNHKNKGINKIDDLSYDFLDNLLYDWLNDLLSIKYKVKSVVIIILMNEYILEYFQKIDHVERRIVKIV
jgi:hypothetical protein